MKLTPWYLAALAPFFVVGLSSSFYGHMVVLMLTLGIFFGTLSLGKAPAAQPGSTNPAQHP